MVVITTTDYQGVSLTEAYDNRSVMAQIARIKDRLTAVEQNVDPALRTDLEAAVTELEALETTVSGIGTQVETNTENIGDIQEDLGDFETSTTAALALKADSADVDADLDLKADKTQLEDGSVTKIGTANVGSSSRFIYLVGGTPTAITGDAALLSKSGQKFTTSVGFNYGFLIGTNKKADITTSNRGKWIEFVKPNAANINKGVSAKAYISMQCDGSTSPNSESVITSTIDYQIETGDEANTYAIVHIFHHLGGEIDLAVTSTSEYVVVYARIPTYASAATNKNDIKMAITEMAGLSDSAGSISVYPVTTVYDDIEYNGMHIPNLTNYTSYQWATIAAGHGVNGDFPKNSPTSIAFRTF